MPSSGRASRRARRTTIRPGSRTYSVAGAAFGFLPLWIALFSFPLMAAIQLMCARLGMVTLASVVRAKYPRWVLWAACAVLIIANVFNIGADLGGMAEATEMMIGVPRFVWSPIYALGLIALMLFTTYR